MCIRDRLLSLCGSQSGGLGMQAGGDGKPLHSGFAARNAVFAFDLVTAVGLSARETPVSYTHLDVYKRQGVSLCLKNIAVKL